MDSEVFVHYDSRKLNWSKKLKRNKNKDEIKFTFIIEHINDNLKTIKDIFRKYVIEDEYEVVNVTCWGKTFDAVVMSYTLPIQYVRKLTHILRVGTCKKAIFGLKEEDDNIVQLASWMRIKNKNPVLNVFDGHINKEFYKV